MTRHQSPHTRPATVPPLWRLAAVLAAGGLGVVEWLVTLATKDEGEKAATIALGVGALVLALSWLVLLRNTAGRVVLTVPVAFLMLRALDGFGGKPAAVVAVGVAELVVGAAALLLIWMGGLARGQTPG